MEHAEYFRALADYQWAIERFKRDGYMTNFEVCDAGLHLAKLVHRNGNRVMVEFVEQTGIIKVLRNGAIIREEKVCES